MMMNRLKWNVDRDDWKKNRRVVEDVPAWIGNDKLLGYYYKCPTDLHRRIFVFLFETGGRVSEVLELQPTQFNWNEEAIRVERMTVLKYRRRMRRDFLIKRDKLNPLTEDLLSFVKDCETKYLFPKGERITGRIIPDKHTSRVRMAENMGIKKIPEKSIKIVEPIEEPKPSPPKTEPKKEGKKDLFQLFKEVAENR